MIERTDTAPLSPWTLPAAGFVLLAVALEVVASARANSPNPAWVETLLPLGWPVPLRVAWWLVVAAAAGAFHLSLWRAGIRHSRLIAWLTVAMFAGFAVGIAVGAEWATWH